MSRKARLRAGAVTLALVALLAAAASAIAAGGAAPKLLSPNHGQVAPGHIRLVVQIPLKPDKGGIFIAITPTKQIDKFGHLKECFHNRCDFVGAKRWKGNKYSFVAPFNFPGYWAVTPGRYFWQVHYYTPGAAAVYYSSIGSFVVR